MHDVGFAYMALLGKAPSIGVITGPCIFIRDHKSPLHRVGCEEALPYAFDIVDAYGEGCVP